MGQTLDVVPEASSLQFSFKQNMLLKYLNQSVTCHLHGPDFYLHIIILHTLCHNFSGFCIKRHKSSASEFFLSLLFHSKSSHINDIRFSISVTPEVCSKAFMDPLLPFKLSLDPPAKLWSWKSALLGGGWLKRLIVWSVVWVGRKTMGSDTAGGLACWRRSNSVILRAKKRYNATGMLKKIKTF